MKIGIIGGSGIYQPDLFKGFKVVEVKNKYGEPASPLRVGNLSGKEVVLLSRHGLNHQFPPAQVNNRANILALKEAGCDVVLATTAVGSLREQIGRGDLVVPHQMIDFTKHRINTFYDDFSEGMQHVSFADPFDEGLRAQLKYVSSDVGSKVHSEAVLITIEGPRFSTRAESNLFRMWGCDIINMTTAPEATLARELDLAYACLALSTDYDCWFENEEPVHFEEVLRIFNANLSKVIETISLFIERI